MQTGLLWFDADKRRSPADKLDRAVARYAERFGRPADLCHVNPADLFVHPTVKIVPNPAILRGHFWVGEDEEAIVPRRRRKAARIA